MGDQRDNIVISFRGLNGIITIVYGAILSYAFVILANSIDYSNLVSSLFSETLLKQLFIINFLISDFAETQVIHDSLPYRGKGRFSIDLSIAMLFLLAIDSTVDLKPDGLIRQNDYYIFFMSAIFFLCVVWSVYLQSERSGKSIKYAGLVFVSHLAAFIMSLILFFIFDNEGQKTILWVSFNSITSMWIAYLAWSVLVIFFKHRLEYSNLVFDFLPIALLGHALLKLINAYQNRKRIVAALLAFLRLIFYDIALVSLKRLGRTLGDWWDSVGGGPRDG